MQPKQLNITNENNKLQCDCFFVLDFAPPKETLREEHFEKTYLVKHDGKDIYMQLQHFWRIPFAKMSSLYTIPATGIGVIEWQQMWLNKNPKTTEDTEIGIYCYKKINA